MRSLRTEGTIDELDTLCAVTLGPVVISATVAEDEVVWAGRQTERANALEDHEDGAAPAGGLAVVHVDALELGDGVAMVGAEMTCQNLAPIWLPNWGEMHAHARVWAAGEEGQTDSLATTVARAGVGDAGGQAAKET